MPLQSGESSDKQDQLTELLNSYSSNGLPSLDSIVNVGVESYSEDAFHVEKHWSEIVANAEVGKKAAVFIYVPGVHINVEHFVCLEKCICTRESQSFPKS